MTSIIATNRKQGGTADGTGTEVSTCLINKWRAKINQEELYNVKVNAPKRGLGKMAKNQSLPAHLQEKDSSSKHDLILYEYYDKPPFGDHGLILGETNYLKIKFLTEPRYCMVLGLKPMGKPTT